MLHSRRIPNCISFLSLPDSPWWKLLASQVNQAMITMTVFDCLSFWPLLQKLAAFFYHCTLFNNSHMIVFKADTSNGGHPRMAHPEDCLGLVLVWTCTKGSMTALQYIFGMSHSNLYMYLRLKCQVIAETLKNDSLATISIPAAEDFTMHQECISAINLLLGQQWMAWNCVSNSQVMVKFSLIFIMGWLTGTTSPQFLSHIVAGSMISSRGFMSWWGEVHGRLWFWQSQMPIPHQVIPGPVCVDCRNHWQAVVRNS